MGSDDSGMETILDEEDDIEQKQGTMYMYMYTCTNV